MNKVDELEGASVLVTGGTGSFGRTMVKNLLDNHDVEQVRVLSRDEAKQEQMRIEIGDGRLRFYLGDTRDRDAVDLAVSGSSHIFHAAALKQVPSGEFFPMEVVKTNIYGSDNVLTSAVSHEVKSVVCLSTDKAVYPINAMGMTKALMEKNAFAIARANLDGPTRICVTRYGNVMHSRGSVIPKFLSLAKSGAPLPITNGSMTRFLMSLNESVDLVKHAFREGKSGDLFVRKAPAATIETLGQAVWSLVHESEAEFKLIGVRHGEKLYESLLSAEEKISAHDEGAYYRVPLDVRDLNYDVFFEQGSQMSSYPEPYTSHNTEQLDFQQTRDLLLTVAEIRSDVKHSA